MQTRPDFVHRLLTFLCDEVLVPHIEATRKELGMPELLMDGRDAWASPPLITLDMADNLDDISIDIPQRESFSDFVRRKGESSFH